MHLQQQGPDSSTHTPWVQIPVSGMKTLFITRHLFLQLYVVLVIGPFWTTDDFMAGFEGSC